MDCKLFEAGVVFMITPDIRSPEGKRCWREQTQRCCHRRRGVRLGHTELQAGAIRHGKRKCIPPTSRVQFATCESISRKDGPKSLDLSPLSGKERDPGASQCLSTRPSPRICRSQHHMAGKGTRDTTKCTYLEANCSAASIVGPDSPRLPQAGSRLNGAAIL